MKKHPWTLIGEWALIFQNSGKEGRLLESGCLLDRIRYIDKLTITVVSETLDSSEKRLIN